MLITIKSKRISIILTGMLCTLVFVSSFSTQSVSSDSYDPYFTLVAKTNGGGTRPDHLNLLKQQLKRININLDVFILDWPTFVGELISYRNFDICYVGLSGGGADPSFTNVYSENGSLNIFGYHTSMDWDEELGTGKNEWYMEQGNLIMPPNSQERVQHYWDWEQYMMDEICPLAPTFTPSDYMAYWHNLGGYNFTDGLLQSWGGMSWDGSHQGQVDTNEVVIADNYWSDLNPLFQDDAASIRVSETIMDRLIWYDADLSVWPHLGTVSYVNDTTIEIVCREGIKWNDDPDGLFSNEYFSAEDVFFTLYLWGHISCDTYLTSWMDELEIIDEMTLRIHIDGDTSTPEKEPYAPGLPFLSTLILPEHYLNQTQIVFNKIMPDITHPSWKTFATNPFGTGLFELTEFSQNFETLLTVREDCWWSNTSITSDPNLDWERRFGDFSGGLEQLRIKIVSSLIDKISMLEHGLIDLTEVTDDLTKRDCFIAHPEFDVQSTFFTYNFQFFGYNMREDRPIIGSRAPCPFNPGMTIGLSVRKAISYAMNREEMNDIIWGGDMTITDWPIYPSMGIWCNPDIIRYDFDLDKARELMGQAGFGDYTIGSPGFRLGWSAMAIISIAAMVFIVHKSKRNKLLE